MDKFYSIVEVIIKSDYIFEDDIWNKFAVIEDSEREKANIVIKAGRGKRYYGRKFIKLKSNDYMLLISNDGEAIVNSEWSMIYIVNYRNFEQIKNIVIDVFNVWITRRKMLLFHSSIIKFWNQGIMFLGPSGIGKTTQAELWKKYRDALIINGDVVLVQETPTPSLAGAPPGMGLLLTVRIPASPWPPWWF